MKRKTVQKRKVARQITPDRRLRAPDFPNMSAVLDALSEWQIKIKRAGKLSDFMRNAYEIYPDTIAGRKQVFLDALGGRDVVILNYDGGLVFARYR